MLNSGWNIKRIIKENKMSIRVSIEDFLQDTLFEMAFQRKTLMQIIRDRSAQISYNLIKIAFFGMRSTWGSEYETLLEDIGGMKFKSRGAFLTKIQYYNMLFDEPFEPFEPWDDSYVYQVIQGKRILGRKEYNKLTHIQINEKNITLIHNKIKELIMKVSELLSDKTNKRFNIIKFQNLTEEYVKFWMEYKSNR